MRDNHTLFIHENCFDRAGILFLKHFLKHISFTHFSFQSRIKSVLKKIKMPASISIQTFFIYKKVETFETKLYFG